MQSVCFPLFFAADDRVRLLTKPERCDFAFHFCPLAAMNRRQPGVIPAMPLVMLSKKLGLDKKVVLKRLLRLSAPGIELIDIQYDAPDENGELSLLSSVSVEILDFADWNGLEDETFDEEDAGRAGNPAPSGAQPQNVAQSQNAAQNGLGTITRKPGAVRVQRLRERRRAESNAKALQNGHSGVTSIQSGVTSGENVTPLNGQNGTREALHPSRMRDDNVQRNGLDLNSKSYKDQDSETLNVTNVIAGPDVTPPVTPAPSAAPSTPGRPPNLRAKVLTSEAVRLARLLKDDTPRPGFPQGNIPRHYQLLAICDQNSLQDLVQRALDATQRKQRRGGLRAPGAYYCDSLVRMLGERNIHVPTADELQAEPASEVQQLIRESMAAGSAAITPLDDILPEMEDTK